MLKVIFQVVLILLIPVTQNENRENLGIGVIKKLGEKRVAAYNTPSMLVYFLDRASVEFLYQCSGKNKYFHYTTKVLKESAAVEANKIKSKALRSALLDISKDDLATGVRKLCRLQKDNVHCEADYAFRTYNGECNNLKNPSWGKANTALSRVLPPQYEDGISAVRESSKLHPSVKQPTPRQLSLGLFRQKSYAHPNVTSIFTYWSMLIDFDIGRVVSSQYENSGFECCKLNGTPLDKNSSRPDSCLPFSFSKNDMFYSMFNITCMSYSRSMTVTVDSDCAIPKKLSQANGVTSFLDMSFLYGSGLDELNDLRERSGGKLKTDPSGNRDKLMKTAHKNLCDIQTKEDFCFLTGDPRINLHPELVVLQTVFLKEHNRVAKELSNLNKHWDDERLFQEARKIMIAQYNVIIYNEWLPLLIGKNHSASLKIKNFTAYKPDVNPSAINSVVTAAFRFIESTVPSQIRLKNSKINSTSFRRSNCYFRPSVVLRQKNSFESVLRSLLNDVDNMFSEELTQFYLRSTRSYGYDIMSINILRGRDHGLPSYNAFRERCGLGKINKFYHLKREMSSDHYHLLNSLYTDVNDIDLLVGALLEKKSPGSLVGPTVACLLHKQFFNSKFGDRFFLSHEGFTHSLDKKKFSQLKRRTLSGLICDNTDASRKIQPNAFMSESNSNIKSDCLNTPKINLQLWKE